MSDGTLYAPDPYEQFVATVSADMMFHVKHSPCGATVLELPSSYISYVTRGCIQHYLVCEVVNSAGRHRPAGG